MDFDVVAAQLPADHRRLVEFLSSDEWPFHAPRRPADGRLENTDFESADVASFWVLDHGVAVGLIRLLDLTDIGAGAPQFDLRIAEAHRGRGLGTAATRWIVDHLCATYPTLHRVEANTRDDNVAMQRALTSAGFVHEGTLRQSWRSATGWRDTMVYGILRSDQRR